MDPILERAFLFKGLRPFSVNASYVRTFNGVSKSSGASEWCAQLFNILCRPEEAAKLAELRSAFDESKHAYSLTIIAYYKESDFYTKKGTISSRTMDLTNTEKLMADCLFLPKFHTLPFPEGAENLNIDDRVLVDLVSKKRPAKEQAIEVTIAIVTRP